MMDIKNYERSAALFEEVANFHLEAAKYYENGDEDKAFQSTIKAQRHSIKANIARREQKIERLHI